MRTQYHSDEEILASVTLILPSDISDTPEGKLTQILSTLLEVQGFKMCIAKWGDPMMAYIPFPATQGRPSPETLVATYKEGKKLRHGTCGAVSTPEHHIMEDK